ncbi:Plasma membrane permease, mediates uptake of glycerophosphoinositol and glycerophosphocholine [Mortierella sp. GBA30]|nr:Plasma membrane permease, mediates uptake of glycerophosphoinositol and glycerophosphocholine [Mortierella sp. GBA30]
MKFAISSVLSVTSAAILLALSAVQVSALPAVERTAADPSPSTTSALATHLEKRDISGLNNYDCKLTPAHPRPLILVHATLLTLDSWKSFAPVLIKQGYCVFALTYGKYKQDVFGGLAPIEDSSQELATFANGVMAKLNATQVDIVGHSQGGILTRYWIKYLDGAGKVSRHVGVSPINHGTTLSSITTIAKALKLFDPSKPIFDGFAPSFYQMVDTSDFIKKLNAGGDTAPGVIHSNIATKFDEVVTPYQTCFQNQPGVTNIILQDYCALSLNEHLTMVNSNVVLQFVLNQLDPSTAKTANCLSLLSSIPNTMNGPKDDIVPQETTAISDEREREKARFALMSDGYQVGILSLLIVCFQRIYGEQFTSEISTRLGNAMFIGVVLGQIGLGYFCDRAGRKVGLMVTTFLVILGAALCASAFGAGGSVEGLFWALTVYRGIVGVGVGGEYPCSSANASESADCLLQGRRGLIVVLVTNTVIDFGFVLAALVPLILAAAGCSYEVIWRASFAFGVLPRKTHDIYVMSIRCYDPLQFEVTENRVFILALSVLYFRLKMTNSELFERNAIKRNVPYRLIFRRYWKHLLGTAGSWFLYDFILYPFGIFSGTILDTALGPDATIVQTAGWMCLLNLFYLPGCVAGAFSADWIGRRKTMAIGFFLQGVLGILLGLFFRDLLGIFPLFVFIYGVFLMLGEYGPGDMVILISAEVFPTAIRGTAYGWSAAIGKLGAICGTSVFKFAIDRFGQGDNDLGQGRVFILASCLALVGALFTWFLIPDYAKQDLNNEDEAFRQYLIDCGYDTSLQGEDAPIRSEELPLIEKQEQEEQSL